MNNVLRSIEDGCKHIRACRETLDGIMKNNLTIADLVMEDRHPDLLDSERERVWETIEHELGKTPISVPVNERVEILRLSSEGFTDYEIAKIFGYPEEQIQIQLFFERHRLSQIEVLKQFHDAYCY